MKLDDIKGVDQRDIDLMNDIISEVKKLLVTKNVSISIAKKALDFCKEEIDNVAIDRFLDATFYYELQNKQSA